MAAVIAGVLAGPAAPSAQAVTGSDFDPGFIISDELFYDGGAMSAADIQSFLNSMIGTCQNGNCLNVAVVPINNRAATYGSRTGNLLCSAISGGSLRVSDLIYRAQVACGISAKVILVTLQKEQGLVTSRAPSASALQKAMGMACPDTAPCDSAFAGLGTQIITGTEQMKAYKANKFARQPGNYYIQYSPNAECGGTTVTIRDYATAALYNYTPYQPNAAALAHLGGTGDGCSSYGNRNFWWYYNVWFGSSIATCTINPTSEIGQYWINQGSASGPLGSAVNPGIVPGPSGTTIGYFANGNVYCTPGVGAIGVLGAVLTKFDALGGVAGPLGGPRSAAAAFVAGGVTGTLQEFQNGTLLSSTTTGTFAVLHGAIRDAWAARGGSGGSLGWPTGDQQTVAGGTYQQFQNGLLAAPIGQSAIVMTGAMATFWLSGQHASDLGLPTTTASAFSAGGVVGVLEYFQNGLVLSSTTTGTHAVLVGPIRAVWGNAGGSGGTLGWPTGDQQTASDGFSQTFQQGTIFGSPSGAGGVLSGTIASYWNAGPNASHLGFPTGSSTAFTAGSTSGTLQYFERGLVLSSGTTGTFSVLNGPIRDAWGAKGGSAGSFGWPTGDQVFASGQLKQQFQGGTLTVGTGVTGDIATYWATGSNATRLGISTGAAAPFSSGGVSGTLQYFQNGMVLSSVTTGTHSVMNGPYRNTWGAQGGSAGALGWPTSDQQTISGGSKQQFQRGSVFVTNGGTGAALFGDISTYWQTGSNAVQLGAPTASANVLSTGGVTGTLQYFQFGLVTSSTTTGTFAVLNGQIRNAWGAQGGSGGAMGWPTGDQQTVTGGVRQQFQRGFVFVPSGGAGVALFGAIGAYWSAGSNAVWLGSPVTSPTSFSAGGLSGTLQTFERGLVLSSTTIGTFAVFNGPIRNAWGALGGSGGSLGWPTADQGTFSAGVQQKFQRGVVAINSDGAAVTLTGAYASYWSTGTNSATIGLPLAPPVAWTASGVTGSYEVFEKGMVLSSTTTGTFVVLDGPIRNTWGAAGGSGGSLGWPTGDQQTVAGVGVRQQFQHGAVVVPTSGAPYATS